MIAIRSTVAHKSRIRKLPTTARARANKSTAPIPPPPLATSTSAPANAIGVSLLAALAGVGIVAGSANVIESMTSDSCLPYGKSAHRFDQSTFGGRFARMLLACDPSLLLCTDATLAKSRQMLEDADADAASSSHSTTPARSRALWEAQRIVDGALHPDTGEIIPRPFRMSGYVPYNGPICVAMIASTSTPSLLFWAWANQSHNALVNYYNRNASAPMSNETLLKSYSAAVGSAMVVALGLSTAVQRTYSPARAKQLMKYIAFPSAVVASSLNCYVVRSPEIATGIPLLDPRGLPIAMETNSIHTNTSNIAARKGVEATTFTRAILSAPVYFFPPLLLGLPRLQQLVAKHPAVRVPLTTFLVLVSFGVGLPATIAIFPQVAPIQPCEVEPKFRHLIDPATQKPYEVFYYNKGL